MVIVYHEVNLTGATLSPISFLLSFHFRLRSPIRDITWRVDSISSEKQPFAFSSYGLVKKTSQREITTTPDTTISNYKDHRISIRKNIKNRWPVES